MAVINVLKALLNRRDELTDELARITHDKETGAELENLTPKAVARAAEILAEIDGPGGLDADIAREFGRVKQARILAEARELAAWVDTQ